MHKFRPEEKRKPVRRLIPTEWLVMDNGACRWDRITSIGTSSHILWKKNEHDRGKGVVSVAVRQQLLGSHRRPLCAGPGRRQRTLISTPVVVVGSQPGGKTYLQAEMRFWPMLTASIATSGRAENGRQAGKGRNGHQVASRPLANSNFKFS